MTKIHIYQISGCGCKTFICFMLFIGIAPQVVMKFSGHSDYKSMKPYIDITEDAKKDAIKLMEAAFLACPRNFACDPL